MQEKAPRRKLLQPSELSTLFKTFSRSAFRLETLPQYLVDSERDSFAAYLAGQALPSPRTGGLKDWDDLIRKNLADGKSMSRIHILPEKLTPYLRYEIEWGYFFSATAGEDIRLILPNAPGHVRSQAKEDFWLFDDEVAVFMVYDQEGRFIRGERELDADSVRECRRIRDLLLPYSIPLREYVAQLRNV